MNLTVYYHLKKNNSNARSELINYYYFFYLLINIRTKLESRNSGGVYLKLENQIDTIKLNSQHIGATKLGWDCFF